MARQRLRCFVSGYPDPAHPHYFPEDDEHPFWEEKEALAEAIYARLLAAGRADPRSVDGLLTTSSDSPRACTSFWVDLSDDDDLRGDVLALCLDHLSRARRALWNVGWELTLDDVPLDWDGDRFSLSEATGK